MGAFDDLVPKKAGGAFDDLTPKVEQNSGILGDTVTDVKRGFEQLPGALTGLADIVNPLTYTNNRRYFDEGADWIGKQTGFQPGKWQEEAAKEYSPERKASDESVAKAWEQGGIGDIAGTYLANPRSIAGIVGQSLPSTLGGGVIARGAMKGIAALSGADMLALRTAAAAGDEAALTAINRMATTAGGIGEGAITAGQNMDQVSRDSDPSRAALTSATAGALTGAIGKYSGRLANKLGLPDLETVMAGGGTGVGGMPWYKRIPSSIVQESLLQEFPQSAQEQIMQNIAEKKPWDEGVARAAIEGALAGAAMGGGVAMLPQQRPNESATNTPPANPLLAQATQPFSTQPGSTSQLDQTPTSFDVPKTLPPSGPLSGAVNVGIASGATSLEPVLLSGQAMQAASEAESQQARVEAAQAQQSAQERYSLLQQVAETLPADRNLKRAFGRALKEAGYSNLDFTPEEAASIDNFNQISRSAGIAANIGPDIEPSAPNELDASQFIKEKGAKPEPKRHASNLENRIHELELQIEQYGMTPERESEIVGLINQLDAQVSAKKKGIAAPTQTYGAQPTRTTPLLQTATNLGLPDVAQTDKTVKTETKREKEKPAPAIEQPTLPPESSANPAVAPQQAQKGPGLSTPTEANTQNAELYAPLVKRLINRKAVAKELGFDIQPALNRAKLAMKGEKQMPGSFRSLANKAERRGDKDTADILRQIADLNDARKNPPKKAETNADKEPAKKEESQVTPPAPPVNNPGEGSDDTQTTQAEPANDEATKRPWQMTRAEVGNSLNAKGWKSAQGVFVVAPSPRSGLYQTTHQAKYDVYLPEAEAAKYISDYNKIAHRRHVEYAIAHGKQVPAEVLAEYPDLQSPPKLEKPETLPERGDAAKEKAATEKADKDSSLVGHKVGDLVKLTKPGVGGRVNIAGTIKKILPGGRFEIKTQSDGYMIVHKSELGHKPAAEVKPNSSATLTSSPEVATKQPAPQTETAAKERAYTPPKSTKEARKRWVASYNDESAPERNAGHAAMLEAVGKALDSGLSRNREINSFVAKELGVTAEQQKIGSGEDKNETQPVDGGAFGYEVSHARQVVESDRYKAANIKAGKEMKLSVGMNIGRIKLRDGKIASAATVESLSDADVTLVAKRGPQTIRTTLSYVSLKVYAERAGNDFFKNRSAQAQDEQPVKPTPAETPPSADAPQSEEEKRRESLRENVLAYWNDVAKPAMVAYLNAFDAMSAGRLERNRAKPEGMTALDWLKKVVSQKPTWDKGRKIGVTGIEMLGKKDLWPTDDGLGERLRKTMLAAVRAYKNAPMWTSEMEQEVFGKPETPAETPKAETPKATKGDNSIRHNVSDAWYYSALERHIDSLNTKSAPAQGWKDQIKGAISKGLVKAAEVEAVGINDWLDLQQGRVSKDQVQQFLDQNGVNVEEVTLGDANTKFSEDDLQLPGGENYKELLLTLPIESDVNYKMRALQGEMDIIRRGRLPEDMSAKENAKFDEALGEYEALQKKRDTQFKLSHFDQPNILAHVRFNERTDADGKRVLFLEELQSDWGQKGKKEGFQETGILRDSDLAWRVQRGRKKDFIEVYHKRTGEIISAYLNTEEEAKRAIEEAVQVQQKLGGKIPSAPFVTNTQAWTALSLKRMIRYAAENGFDKVAWTTGEQQADRYDLSKQVDSINYRVDGDDTFEVSAIKDGESVITEHGQTAEQLEGLLGKEIAKKIVAGEGAAQRGGGNVKQLSGIDLKVGGEGMKGYYDRIVPSVANDVLKKLGGGRVEAVGLGRVVQGVLMSDRPYLTQQGFDITPKMRESVMSGQALFNRTKSEKLSPSDKAIYGMAAEGKSAKDILKFIAASSRNPFYRQLARILLKTGIAPNITVGDGKGFTFNAGNDKKYAASYDPKTDTVALFRPASSERHALHEFVHAATIKALSKNGMASAQMRALFNHAKATGKLEGMYGKENVDEFVAEAFSNPKFQEVLKQIAAPEGSARKTVWDRFISVIRGILGLKPISHDALSRALSLGLGVMHENMKLSEGKNLTTKGNVGAGSVGGGISSVLFYDGNENAIVWDDGDYRISVNMPGRSTSSVLWHKESVKGKDYWAKRGHLSTFESEKFGKKWLRVQEVAIEGEHRGSGLGLKLYQFLLDQSGADIAGILSHSASITNKKQVPAIHRKLGAKLSDSGDFYMITKPEDHVGAGSATINVDGVERPRLNSNGKPIAQTDEGIRNFWKWFGDSKVTDDQGRPLVVYHGTDTSISQFNPRKRGSNTGALSARKAFWFSSNSNHAENFNASRIGNNVMPAYLSLKSAKVIEHSMLDAYDAHPAVSTKAETRRLKELSAATRKGLDGVVFNNTFDTYASSDDGSGAYRVNLYAVFRPEQIKSASGNNGQFSPDSNDIRYNVASDWIDNNAPASAGDGDTGSAKAIPRPEIPRKLSQKEFSSILQDIDGFGPIDADDPYRIQAFKDIVKKLKAVGVDYIDMYHVTDASLEEFKSEGIRGSSLDFIGRSSGDLRGAAVYGFLDPDDIKKSYAGILGAESETPNVIHIKVPVNRIGDFRWDGNFNITHGAYSGISFEGNVPTDWIAGSYSYNLAKNTPASAGSGDIRYNVIGDSGRAYDQAHRDFFKNVGRDINPESRIQKSLNYLRNDFWKKMAVGLVDQFRGLKDLGDNGTAYMLARLSKGTAGAFDTLLHHGKLTLRDGVYDGDTSGGFVERLGIPLHGELDDVLWWIAANRAGNLAPLGKENLFSPSDIAAGKSLANGTTAFDYTIQTGPARGTVTRNRSMIYTDAHRVFNEFQKNTLDMAEQSGLIDGNSRKTWESEFYVPFYRVSEEDGEFVGAKISGSLVRKRAFQKLKGGTDKLNSDLLSNTLQNWAHLITASAQNRAARASLAAAENIGVAQRVAPDMASYAASNGTMLPPGTKKTVWFQENGKKVEYLVTDPFVMTAITSLEYAGMRNGIMDAMTKFKHALTIGVTASPAFKVRNLIRDSLQAIGTSDLGYNPIKNVTEGYKQTRRDSQEYVSALASGGLIRFGTMLEGSESSRVRQLIKAGVKDSTILNSGNKWQAFYDKVIDPAVSAYNELGNRSEEINRAALYNQLIKQGKSHAEAALLARDLMDFSMQGSFNTIRFLSQVVPFFNARLQGMYKLGRAAKDDPKKMAVVTGALALASIALMAGYEDDDDWKRREDWDRDNYWWFKLGGIEYRIPKPFELGAVATLAERSVEYLTNDEMTGERFRNVIGKIAENNLSMNPVPQMVKPIIDLYANKDSFTGRPIETMGMQRLDSDMRFNSNTSMPARALSTATLGALSPVQYDHLVRAYFGWIGATAVSSADMAARVFMNEPTKPAMDYWKVATQGMMKEQGSGSSRYLTLLYDQASELEQAYGTYRQLLKDGKLEDANDYYESNADKLKRYKFVNSVKSMETKLNASIRSIERSDASAEEKKARIERVQAMKERVAKRVAPGLQ